MSTARLFSILLPSLLLTASAAWAQDASAIDDAWDDPKPPSTPAKPAAVPAKPAVAPAAPAPPSGVKARVEEAWGDDDPPQAVTPARRRAEGQAEPGAEAAAPGRRPGRAAARAVADTPPPPPALPDDAPPLALTRELSEREIDAAFRTWRDHVAAGRSDEAEVALQALLDLKAAAQAAALDAVAMAVLRVAEAQLEQGQSLRAVSFARAAVQLAPSLPSAHFGLARISLQADATDPGRALSAFSGAVGSLWARSGHARGVVGNVGTVGLIALIGTGGLGIALLFVRGARRFFHDFHHLFPRGARRWQTVTIALLLLALPLVLRLGMLPVLIALALAVSMALSLRERGVSAALLVLVGLVPLATGVLVERSGFVGTIAEDVSLLGDGGSGAERAAARVEARRLEDRAGAAELLALGSFQGRRGQLARAEATLRQAGALEPGNGRVMTNLGNVRFAHQDLEGALKLYEEAARADPTLIAPHLNAASLHERRATRMDVGDAIRERDRAQQARNRAKLLQPDLEPSTAPPRPILNLLVDWPQPDPAALAALARSPETSAQISQQAATLIGRGTPMQVALMGVLGALAVLGLGALRRPLKASSACLKCGGEACRRCDGEVAGGLCVGCSNAFGKRGVVPPQQRARKQQEIERQRSRRQRIASGLGLVVSGAGHVVSGAPLIGITSAFLFLAGVVTVVLHRGVLRPVMGGLDAGMILVLVVLLPLLFVLHLWTIRALRRRLGEES